MASVDLTRVSFSAAAPTPLQFGGPVQPGSGAGGPRIDRQGSRWMMRCAPPRMRVEPDGRLLFADLTRGISQGVIVRVRQPNFINRAFVPVGGAATVADNTSSGRVVPITGMSPNALFRKGQWLNYVVDGQHYLDMVAEEAIADGSGDVDVTLANMIREPLTSGDTIRLDPVIEGSIDADFGGGWGPDRLAEFAFMVVEDA